ncbi:DUF3368 domain-containing protein [Leptolyngbya sp. FACHB-321]|uniref:DUF3368 domain-containing protein n=1 Tax=Leptolyngbya sp. FACHB-321 TaxID=2692807 RepID=UPI0016856BCD|nr:DUF3368 domain-containing protein [Leptolyngbya sp. FACHB-321]MBD2035637.1 DUF3368 domain-containing protein [Leptolyngbya sp. FACHB-321]
MIVVSDTSPISNLAAIGQLVILQQLYSEVIIPTAVHQELLNSGSEDPAVLAIQTLDWIQIRSVTNAALLQPLQTILDVGEAEVIALAIELTADRLLMDERRGRQQAIQAGLKVTGLLGILLAAKQQKVVTTVKPLLDALIANGFWVHGELYAETLSLVGE